MGMLGYVTCENSELKMRDFEIYNGYYCGICKSIGRRYGQLPRMVLSYDAVFLALILAGSSNDEEKISKEHCVMHHIKKKTIVRNDTVDYAADIMLILAWHKVLDDAEDEGKLYAKVTVKVMNRIYKKLRKAHSEFCNCIEENLKELNKLEQEKCNNLDKISDLFAKVMSKILSDYDAAASSKRELSRFGYDLGKWIYLMDAWEDIEENIESGAYNPLLYRFEFEEENESQEDFRKRIYDIVERNLMIYLAEMAKTLDLLDVYRNSDIIENVVYMGLLRRTEKALGKEDINE